MVLSPAAMRGQLEWNAGVCCLQAKNQVSDLFNISDCWQLWLHPQDGLHTSTEQSIGMHHSALCPILAGSFLMLPGHCVLVYKANIQGGEEKKGFHLWVQKGEEKKPASCERWNMLCKCIANILITFPWTIQYVLLRDKPIFFIAVLLLKAASMGHKVFS